MYYELKNLITIYNQYEQDIETHRMIHEASKSLLGNATRDMKETLQNLEKEHEGLVEKNNGLEERNRSLRSALNEVKKELDEYVTGNWKHYVANVNWPAILCSENE